MFHSHVRPVRELRNNYPELAELVKRRDHVIITNNGKSEAVLIGFDEFRRYEEYLHYRYIEEQLAEAEKEAADPNVKWIPHEEVWRALREEFKF